MKKKSNILQNQRLKRQTLKNQRLKTQTLKNQRLKRQTLKIQRLKKQNNLIKRNIIKRNKLQKGGYLEDMPQICFGTAQNNLKKTLSLALEIGYRHIDCADAYGGNTYKTIIKDAIKIIPREKLWITWKSSSIDDGLIPKIIEQLDCGYIDLFLIHFGCGKPEDFDTLKQAQTEGLIRFFGVSNCENIETIRELKINHNIYANQIQARPPHGTIANRKQISENFIENCNDLDVKIMLFGTISGIQNQTENFEYFDYLKDINAYYIQKYIKGTNNVLIISSISGSSLKTNLDDINKILNEEDLLSDEQMIEIEKKISNIKLSYQ